MYDTVIKQNRHLRMQRKCWKHELQASVLYISRVFSNGQSVKLSQCNTQLKFLHLLYEIEVMWWKTKEHAFSIIMFYALIKHGFFDQSECIQGPIYIINFDTSGKKIWLIKYLQLFLQDLFILVHECRVWEIYI